MAESGSRCDLPGLGQFTKLPLEIRYVIWQHLLSDEHTLTKDCEGVLQASRELYEEVSHEIYGNRTITFRLSRIKWKEPEDEDEADDNESQETDLQGELLSLRDQGQDWPSSISVHDNFGLARLLLPCYCRYDWLREFWSSNAMIRSLEAFENLPFYRLKGVKIDLEPPDPKDPGTMVKYWSELLWLNELFGKCDSLPDIQVSFLEDEDRKWYDAKGNLQSSIADEDNSLKDWNSDIDLIMRSFKRLRSAKSITFHTFSAPLDDTIMKAKALIIKSATSMLPFGSDEGDDFVEDDFGDYEILVEERVCTTWLDYILDDVEGPSAAQIRLHRFATWNQEYESLTRDRRVDSKVHRSDVDFSEIQIRSYTLGRDSCAFNPLNLKNLFDKLKERDDDYLSSQEEGEIRKDFWRGPGDTWLPIAQRISGTSQRALYRFYPDGIPQRNSRDYKRVEYRHEQWIHKPEYVEEIGNEIEEYQQVRDKLQLAAHVYNLKLLHMKQYSVRPWAAAQQQTMERFSFSDLRSDLRKAEDKYKMALLRFRVLLLQ